MEGGDDAALAESLIVVLGYSREGEEYSSLRLDTTIFPPFFVHGRGLNRYKVAAPSFYGRPRTAALINIY